MRVSQSVDVKYGYHENFNIIISAAHDDYTKCYKWSSVTKFGSKKFETPAGGNLNRYPEFYGSPRGMGNIETVAVCHCAKDDGEAMVVDSVEIVRTQLVVSSRPSKAKIYESYYNVNLEFTRLLTTESIELGAISSRHRRKLKLKRVGYKDATRTVEVKEGEKTEIHVDMKKV